MSLFDDILKQSTLAPTSQWSSGQSGRNPPGGNPPQDDPLATGTNSIIISDATPMVSVLDIVQPPIEVPAGTPMKIVESNDSIIIDDSVSEASIAPISVESQESITPMALPEVPTSNDISLIDTLSIDTTEESSLVSLISDTDRRWSGAVFHDTHTYIGHAIDEVTDLIAGIDAQDAMVLAAEDEHRKQKEHYAELEIADEAAHQRHLEERAHAEKMKKYLEKEQWVALKKNEEKEAVTA